MIDIRREKFFQDINSESITTLEIVEKYIMSGTPYVFSDNEDTYYELKREIANHFTLSNINNIIMVGSAKLGFSINPENNFSDIQDDSDIDMVVIDDDLFDVYWKRLFEFNINITVRTYKEDESYQKFKEYFFKGWIRPDLFPFSYHGKNEWFDFFRKISYNKYDKRKITCAIFKDDYFFKKYHERNITAIRRSRENEQNGSSEQ